MSLISQILRFSIIVLFLLGTNFSFFMTQVQSQDEAGGSDSDIRGQQSDEEELDGEQHVEKAIKEAAEARTLEQESDDYHVDWRSWAETVSGAVWGPLVENRVMVCGQSRVRWQVTSDCRTHIISVYTPIPNGAQGLVNAIKALDHNPILAFPTGSTKTVVWRSSRVGGRPIMHRVHNPAVYP